MDPSTQIQKMLIGPGSAKSVGSFMDPKPKKGKKKAWLHGGQKTKQKASFILGI